jgi:NAD(P)-dependent dehydrogenase (short-subunit alcohol dehydrogenase family)
MDLDGRVCIVTGAGRGIGREHALMLAAHGARVVVNDLGGARDGTGADAGPARDVVTSIVGAGGQAVANSDDVSDWAGAERLVLQAVDTFGGLDVVVNNAGILRDRMLVNMTEDEWDAVIRVHLRGTFAPSRHAAAYWRDRAKRGEHNDARIINTTSISGLYANPGQSNYGAAKAGIAAFTLIAAQELARYGVTVNAIAPGALTRMTEDTKLDPDMRPRYDPRWVSTVVAWLASADSRDISGEVIESNGLVVAIAEGWHRGPTGAPPGSPDEVGPVVRRLLAGARPYTRIAETA